MNPTTPFVTQKFPLINSAYNIMTIHITLRCSKKIQKQLPKIWYSAFIVHYCMQSATIVCTIWLPAGFYFTFSTHIWQQQITHVLKCIKKTPHSCLYPIRPWQFILKYPPFISPRVATPHSQFQPSMGVFTFLLVTFLFCIS